MGRELQKKKNKSSLPRRRQNAPSKKKILQNPIIAANWYVFTSFYLQVSILTPRSRNQKETLSQNYRRLGLTARLNHSTGGTEKTIASLSHINDPTSARTDVASGSTANALNIVSSAPRPTADDVEEIEVERDPDTGAIIRVVGGDSKPNDNPLNDPLNELDDDSAEGEEWTGFAMVPKDSSDNPVIRQLEAAARNGVRKAPRGQSQRETEWVERLVNKYGEDYDRMARDAKLNPMQQTAADIRKRVKKWNESKGSARKVWT
jgi:nucleolar protein 16